MKIDKTKIYYIHGYLSSPDSTKGNLLKQKLNAESIRYRDCKPEDLVISECIINIEERIKNDKNPILIGSSLGGFLSAKIALDEPKIKKLVLFNPAIIPKDYDISKIKDMPQRILKDMIEPRFFNEKIQAEILILNGIKDEVVPNNWVINFAKSQEAIIRFLNDDHRLSNNLEKLPVFIKKFCTKD